MNVKGYSQFPSTAIHNLAITFIDLETFSWRCDEGGNTVDCLMYHYSGKVIKVHKNDVYGGKKVGRPMASFKVPYKKSGNHVIRTAKLSKF